MKKKTLNSLSGKRFAKNKIFELQRTSFLLPPLCTKRVNLPHVKKSFNALWRLVFLLFVLYILHRNTTNCYRSLRISLMSLFSGISHKFFITSITVYDSLSCVMHCQIIQFQHERCICSHSFDKRSEPQEN